MSIFEGRINKETYIAGLALLYILFVVGIFLFIILPIPQEWRPSVFVLLIGLIAMYHVSLILRRVHDTGLDGTNFFYTYYATQEGQNKWGAQPKPGIHVKALFGLE
jgi:uncharacterized membrane protein YhaH (DUF805 family)